jgi:hypothetical protein
LDCRLALYREKLPGEWERLTNGQSHDSVEFPREREVQEGRVRDTSGHTPSRGGDPADLMLRQDVVGPLEWRVYRK